MTNDSDQKSGEQKAVALVGQVVPLLFLTSIFFVIFMSRIVLAPLLPNIEKDLVIGHGEAGSLFFWISSGYFISTVCSGFVSAGLTHRRTIVLSSSLLGLSFLALSFSGNLWQMRLCLFVLGISGGLYLPSGIATLTSMIDPAHWGKALAVHEMAPNLCFVVAPIAAEIMLRSFSWRAVFVLLGAAALLLGLAFARSAKGGNFPGQAPSLPAFKILFHEPSFWIMVLLFTLGAAASMGIFSMLPLYLVTERGMEREWANNLIGLSRISGVFIAFLSGWITDRLGPKPTLAGVFVITGILTILLGISPGSWLVTLLFLQPIIIACFFPAAFAALSHIGPASFRSFTVSMNTALVSLFGGGLTPVCLGFLGETVSLGFGITLLGCLMAAGFWFSLRLKFSQQ